MNAVDPHEEWQGVEERLHVVAPPHPAPRAMKDMYDAQQDGPTCTGFLGQARCETEYISRQSCVPPGLACSS